MTSNCWYLNMPWHCLADSLAMAQWNHWAAVDKLLDLWDLQNQQTPSYFSSPVINWNTLEVISSKTRENFCGTSKTILRIKKNPLCEQKKMMVILFVGIQTSVDKNPDIMRSCCVKPSELTSPCDIQLLYSTVIKWQKTAWVIRIIKLLHNFWNPRIKILS